jgi:hypothetical protein
MSVGLNIVEVSGLKPRVLDRGLISGHGLLIITVRNQQY